jgi:hypothetical protein
LGSFSRFCWGFLKKRVAERGFLVVNLWWDRGDLWCIGWHFYRLKNFPWIPDLFLSDSRFGNGQRFSVGCSFIAVSSRVGDSRRSTSHNAAAVVCSSSAPTKSCHFDRSCSRFCELSSTIRPTSFRASDSLGMTWGFEFLYEVHRSLEAFVECSVWAFRNKFRKNRSSYFFIPRT